MNNAGIDFIAEKQGEKHYYQVALSMLEGNTMPGIKNIDLRSFLSE